MARFLIDEDLPRSLTVALRHKAHQADHVIDVGLRGASDPRIVAAAQEQRAILLSRDADFGNILQYPPGSHHGIVLVRFPTETRTRFLASQIVEMLALVRDEELQGNLIIFEPGRVRLRRTR